MIASAKEIDALNITLFNSCINFTDVHLCNYCTKIFVIVVNTCVCRRSVDNKALILILSLGPGVAINLRGNEFHDLRFQFDVRDPRSAFFKLSLFRSISDYKIIYH